MALAAEASNNITSSGTEKGRQRINILQKKV